MFGLVAALRQWFCPVQPDWKAMREVAEAYEEALKRIHDLTQEHTWIDVTSFNDTQPIIVCRFCSARRDECGTTR